MYNYFAFVIGLSKGYGLVEFAHNRDKSEQARSRINGLHLDRHNSLIRCQFVDDSIKRFSELHSRCLHVTNLPATNDDDKSGSNIERELKTSLGVLTTPKICLVNTFFFFFLFFYFVFFLLTITFNLHILTWQVNGSLWRMNLANASFIVICTPFNFGLC